MTTDTIYVRLLDEDVDVSRPTKGVAMGDGRYLLLASEGYNADDEHWEFLPGTTVECEWRESGDGPILLAVKRILDQK